MADAEIKMGVAVLKYARYARGGRVNPMAWVTFTDPEVAQVGLSETAARERSARAAVRTRLHGRGGGGN